MTESIPCKKVKFRRAGHRSWAAGNARLAGGHAGDIMSPEKRSKLMAAIKGKNTGPERIVFDLLERSGERFKKHVRDLPGRPDVVFQEVKLAVFIDGNFWHGWRFPLWKHKLSDKWIEKISKNRERDKRNFCKLRRLGWKVLRLWEHQIERSPEECVKTILDMQGMRCHP